jgi:hypothetical protein
VKESVNVAVCREWRRGSEGIGERLTLKQLKRSREDAEKLFESSPGEEIHSVHQMSTVRRTFRGALTRAEQTIEPEVAKQLE